LAERKHLTDDALGHADDRHQRVRALAQRVQTLRDTLRIITRLGEMLLQRGAVAAARSHRDLRLQHANQRLLGRMRLVEVLNDFLLSWVHAMSNQREMWGTAQ